MTDSQWQIFDSFRTEFKQNVNKWSAVSAELAPLQSAAALKDTPPYPIETSVVYNRALDEITPADEIKLIVIADNPGKDEQLKKNSRYLVGQSGKIADGFFRRNPELKIDFRRNVIILNKTPVHTAKTLHLKKLISSGNPAVSSLIAESQLWMAQKTAALHASLCECGENAVRPDLWLVGYAELKDRGIFTSYRREFKRAYGNAEAWNSVYVFQHFAMNRFLINLNAFRSENPQLNLIDSIHMLGAAHKENIFTD